MPGKQAETILAAWREVERRLDAAAGEDEREALRAEAALLRDEYQRLVEAETVGEPEPAHNTSHA